MASYHVNIATMLCLLQFFLFFAFFISPTLSKQEYAEHREPSDFSDLAMEIIKRLGNTRSRYNSYNTADSIPTPDPSLDHEEDENGDVAALYELKNTNCQQNVQEGRIIRASDSLNAGASYIDAIKGISTNKECQEHCCKNSSCDVAVYQDKEDRYCYLFLCDGKCVFKDHPGYFVNTITHSSPAGSSGQATESELESLTSGQKNVPLPGSSDSKTADGTGSSADVSGATSQSAAPSHEPVISVHSVSLSGYCTQDMQCEDTNAGCLRNNCRCRQGFYNKRGICRMVCQPSSFECYELGTITRGPECIPMPQVCDSYMQCADGSDEFSCEAVNAGDGQQSDWTGQYMAGSYNQPLVQQPSQIKLQQQQPQQKQQQQQINNIQSSNSPQPVPNSNPLPQELETLGKNKGMQVPSALAPSVAAPPSQPNTYVGMENGMTGVKKQPNIVTKPQEQPTPLSHPALSNSMMPNTNIKPIQSASNPKSNSYLTANQPVLAPSNKPPMQPIIQNQGYAYPNQAAQSIQNIKPEAGQVNKGPIYDQGHGQGLKPLGPSAGQSQMLSGGRNPLGNNVLAPAAEQKPISANGMGAESKIQPQASGNHLLSSNSQSPQQQLPSSPLTKIQPTAKSSNSSSNSRQIAKVNNVVSSAGKATSLLGPTKPQSKQLNTKPQTGGSSTQHKSQVPSQGKAVKGQTSKSEDQQWVDPSKYLPPNLSTFDSAWSGRQQQQQQQQQLQQHLLGTGSYYGDPASRFYSGSSGFSQMSDNYGQGRIPSSNFFGSSQTSADEYGTQYGAPYFSQGKSLSGSGYLSGGGYPSMSGYDGSLASSSSQYVPSSSRTRYDFDDSEYRAPSAYQDLAFYSPSLPSQQGYKYNQDGYKPRKLYDNFSSGFVEKQVPNKGSSSSSQSAKNSEISQPSLTKTVHPGSKANSKIGKQFPKPADPSSSSNKENSMPSKDLPLPSNSTVKPATEVKPTPSQAAPVDIDKGSKDVYFTSTREKVIIAGSGDAMGPIVALSLGLALTLVVLVMVVCRLRGMRHRLRKGRPLNQNEADYLINGMYL